MNPYIGHPQQLYGVTELRLTGGKGDAMRQSGQLEFLAPDAVKEHHLCFRFTEEA